VAAAARTQRPNAHEDSGGASEWPTTSTQFHQSTGTLQRRRRGSARGMIRRCASGGDVHYTCTSLRSDLAHRHNILLELDQRQLRGFVDIRIRLSRGAPRAVGPQYPLRISHHRCMALPGLKASTGGLRAVATAPPVGNVPISPRVFATESIKPVSAPELVLSQCVPVRYSQAVEWRAAPDARLGD
jgi:hypothetical protein